MLDQFTESSEEGFFSRIMSSIMGAVFGLLLFAGSFVLLWWNEGNVIAEKEAIQELSAHTRIDANKPSAEFNGKIVYTNSKLTSNEKLGDQFLQPGPYLRLQRKVEMYQWVEESKTKTTKKLGGGKKKTKTYTYKKRWQEGVEDSSQFKKQEGHVNPSLPYKSESFEVRSAQFGKFNGLPVLQRVSQLQDLKLQGNQLKDKSFKLQGNYFYKKSNPTASGDQIGDIRISYSALPPGGTYSILAEQNSPTQLAAHTATNGKTKFLVEAGAVPPKQMISSAKDGASTMANILRFVGWFVMFMGINMVLAPFATFLDVIPFLGSAGRFVIALFAGVVSAVLSSITIIVGMIAHNPIALAVVMAASAGGIGYLIIAGKKKKRAKAAQGGGANSVPPQAVQTQAPSAVDQNQEPPRATGT